MGFFSWGAGGYFFNGQISWQVGGPPPAKPKTVSVGIYVHNSQKRPAPELELFSDEEAIRKSAVVEDALCAELLAQKSSLARDFDNDE